MTALIEMTEEELRNEIANRKLSFQKTQMLADKFGSVECQGRANSKLKKYADALYIAYQLNFCLTEEEKQVVSHLVARIS